MPSRFATLCVAVTALGSGCSAFNQTIRHEVTWQPAVYAEVSRESRVALTFEEVDGAQWVTATETSACVEEATQTGVEEEERKPKDWVLGIGAVLGGGATAVGIGVLGGALTSQAITEGRNGEQSGAGQIVGTAIGLAGTFGQLLLYKKIIEGLNAIRFERTRPVTQELGRKVDCGQGVLFRARLADD